MTASCSTVAMQPATPAREISEEEVKTTTTSKVTFLLLYSICVSVGRHLTICKVAVGSRVNGVTERELDLLVAAEVESVCRPRPHRQHIHSSDWPPHAFSPYDLPQGVHHVPVARSWLGVQTLHACLV